MLKEFLICGITGLKRILRKGEFMAREKKSVKWVRDNFWNVLVIILLWEIFKFVIKLIIVMG